MLTSLFSMLAGIYICGLHDKKKIQERRVPPKLQSISFRQVRKKYTVVNMTAKINPKFHRHRLYPGAAEQRDANHPLQQTDYVGAGYAQLSCASTSDL